MHWYYQLLGDVGQVGQVNSSAVSKPAVEDSLMTEIANTIQLFATNKYMHLIKPLLIRIFNQDG